MKLIRRHHESLLSLLLGHRKLAGKSDLLKHFLRVRSADLREILDALSQQVHVAHLFCGSEEGTTTLHAERTQRLHLSIQSSGVTSFRKLQSLLETSAVILSRRSLYLVLNLLKEIQIVFM